MKSTSLSVSAVCAGIALAFNASSATFTFAPEQAGTRSPAGYLYSGELTDPYSEIDWAGHYIQIAVDGVLAGSPPEYPFTISYAPWAGSTLKLHAEFNADVGFHADNEGEYWVEFSNILFRLQGAGGTYYWDAGPFISPSVFTTGSGDYTAHPTWSGTKDFGVPAQGTYKLSWAITSATLGHEATKSGTVTSTTYGVNGSLVPEPGEYAMIAVFGLAAFAGWRRVRG